MAQAAGENPLGLKKSLKLALTRREYRRRRGGKIEVIELPPSARLLYGLYFALVFLVGLIVLEIAHLLILRTWNSEIFAAITGTSGTVVGVFLTQRG